MPVMTQRTKIEGIKLSNELIAIDFRNIPDSEDLISHVCELFALNQINMPFLSVTRNGKKMHLSCCVSVEDKTRIKDLFHSESILSSSAECISGVGLLSIFPHQSSMKILGLSLQALGEACLPIYGLASSLSALTFVMDYTHLNKAVTSLREYLDIPPDQVFLKPEIQIRQIGSYKKDP
jgi:aspartokinase